MKHVNNLHYVGYKLFELGDKLKKGLIFSFEKKDPDCPLNEHPQGYRVAHVGSSFVSYAPLSKVERRKSSRGKEYLYIPSIDKMGYDTTIYILEEVSEKLDTLPVDSYYKELSSTDALQMTCYGLSWVIGLTSQIDNFISSYADTLEQIYDAREKQSYQMWYDIQLESLRLQLSTWTSHVSRLNRFHSFTADHISSYVKKHKKDFTEDFLTKYHKFYKL